MSTRNTKRRWLGVGTGAVALLIVGLGLGVAAASSSPSSSSSSSSGPGTIVCPSVADKLPAIPAPAKDEVTRNLQQLDTQVAEANNRLVTSQGQGGPNFVNNAILGPLKDKRAATIDRIAIAIGRHAARPTGLDGLAGCALVAGGAQPPVVQTVQAPPPVVVQTTAPATGAGSGAGSGAGAGAGAAGTITCPTVADKLPAIPAQAQDEVTRNLQQLDTQVAEANNRLVSTRGQGGPNFVNNAILGPLKDKRFATINRIATAIGRHAPRPQGLAEALSACTLN
jgi:hypothetical protein